MGLINFVKNFFGSSSNEVSLSSCSSNIDIRSHYKTLALYSAVNLISNTVASCEYQTYMQQKSTKSDTYYTLNVEANPNQNSYEFWKETIRKLLIDGKVLVVLVDKNLYIADSFTKKEYSLLPNQYTDIYINNYKLNDTFSEDEVLFLSLNNEKLNAAINEVTNDYYKLLSSSQKSYRRSMQNKFKFNIGTHYTRTEEGQQDLQDFFDEDMKDFMNPDKDTVLPLREGETLEEAGSGKNASKSSSNASDIKGFIDEIFDFIAIAFNIPPSLLKGDVVDTKDAVNNFLTFAIKPLVTQIEKELNRKLYSKKEFLEGCYIKIDMSNIRVVDIRDVANSIDILQRNAAFTINDSLEYLGMPKIEDEIGNMRFVTKNYSTIEEVVEEYKMMKNQDN